MAIDFHRGFLLKPLIAKDKDSLPADQRQSRSGFSKAASFLGLPTISKSSSSNATAGPRMAKLPVAGRSTAKATGNLQFSHISNMRPEYVGENIAKPGIRPVKYLRGEELKQYLVTAGPNGEALDGSGRPLDTTNGGRAYKAIGTLTPSGDIYVAHRASDSQNYRIQHSSFVNGGAAAAGFEIHSTDGKKLVLWPNSGHYRTTAEQMEQLRSALRAKGIMAEIEIKGLETERPTIE